MAIYEPTIASIPADPEDAWNYEAVCTENLDSDVMVMKSTKDRVRANDTGSLNRARNWCIFIQ